MYDTMHKSWTNDFMNMRLAAHAGKCSVEREPELKLLCEFLQVCNPVVDLFLADITKAKQPTVKTKLQNFVKAAKRNSECSSCGRPLYVPKDRKECVVCDDVFCSKCSTKNLVVYYPRGTVQQADIEQGKIQPTMNVFASGVDLSTIAEIWRNYRTCDTCHFNFRLQDCHHELMDLSGQILATLNRALDANVHEIKMDRSASLNNLDETGEKRFDGFPRSQSDVDVLSKCEAKMAEERVTRKLFNRYWNIYTIIRTQLKPVTKTQTLLHKHIRMATQSFYLEKRSTFSVRYDSSVSSTSDDD